jgi:hypothetical protein
VLAVIAAFGLAVAVALSPLVMLPAPVHDTVLFGHLAALILGFGAVLALDWHGGLWLIGRISLEEMLTTIGRLTTAVWLGLGVLVATGALLPPDLGSSTTRLKMALVAIAGLNGLYASSLHEALSRASRLGGGLPTTLLIRGLATGAVSQVAWWGATIIGFRAAH